MIGRTTSMRTTHRDAILWMTALLGAFNLTLGWAMGQAWVSSGGALGLAYVWQRSVQGRRPAAESKGAAPSASAGGPSDHAADAVPRSRPAPGNPAGLVETMLAQGRSALLLRAQIARNLSEEQFRRAIQDLTEVAALVPAGEVLLGQTEEAPEIAEFDLKGIAAGPIRAVRVEPFLLDRYPVTNRQFYEFVAAGGYQDASLWDPAILSAVLGFVDQTGQPGPRFWRGGSYDPAKKDHPVVGVSWYEATAYARWVGKRLPTDAEWVKAGSWPVSLSAGGGSQRRYPWGDAMDRSRANLWGSGPAGTVPVTAFAGGMSVGSVYQLLGNVWEWMRGSFPSSDAPDGEWILETPMKSIRGGAFDTYFDNQATCQFQSGEAAVARRHNVGFRCAVGVCDLLLARPVEGDPPPAPAPIALLEELPA